MNTPGEHGLCYDPDEACRHLSRTDHRLAALIAQAGPLTLRPEPTQSVFTALCRSIVYQQLSGKAAATILGRVRDLFPAGRITPRRLLQTDPARLRGAGLSAAKLAALQDLSRKSEEGLVPTMARIRRMADEDIIERLTAVRGIGRWTVEMLLMFRLGRPDVLPVGDLGVRAGFAHLRGRRKLPEPAQLARAAEPWRPYRSAASWYLWRAVDLHRSGELIVPRPAPRPAPAAPRRRK